MPIKDHSENLIVYQDLIEKIKSNSKVFFNYRDSTTAFSNEKSNK